MPTYALYALHFFVRLGLVAAACSFAVAASAQPLPYSFSVESFAIPERTVFDDFDNDSIDPAWNSIRGNAIETGSTLILSNPGETGFLPPPLSNESTIVSGQGLQLDFGGSFTATSIWSQQVPAFGEGMNFSLGSIDGSGNVHQFSVGLSDTPPAVVPVLGGEAGLGINVLSVIRDAPDGNILSVSRSSIAIGTGDITGQIHLALAFDDAANTLQALYSLDGGATTQTAGSATAWNFSGGGFSLSASSTVPEPGTALLLGLGLAGLSAARRQED